MRTPTPPPALAALLLAAALGCGEDNDASGALSGPAAEVVVYTNQARASGARCGGESLAPAPALEAQGALVIAAQGHADDMASRSYFSHDSLDGTTFDARIRRNGYAGVTLGENIAERQRDARSVVDGWLNSAGHCANIMNPDFTEIGVGYASGSSGPLWVQNFGAR